MRLFGTADVKIWLDPATEELYADFGELVLVQDPRRLEWRVALTPDSKYTIRFVPWTFFGSATVLVLLLLLLHLF